MLGMIGKVITSDTEIDEYMSCVYSLPDHEMTEQSMMCLGIMHGKTTIFEIRFYTIVDLVHLLRHQIALIDIYYFAKLSLLMKTHLPVLCHHKRTLVWFGLIGWVKLSPEIFAKTKLYLVPISELKW